MASVERRDTPRRTVPGVDRKTGEPVTRTLPARTAFLARWRDQDGKPRAKSFPTKKAAKAFLDAEVVARASGVRTDTDAAKVTLRSFYDDSFAPTREWSSRTKALHDYTMRTLGSLADRPMRNLVQSDIAKWVKGLTDGGMADSTARAHLTRVKTILKSAVDDDVLAKSPVRGKMPVKARPRVEGAVDPERLPTPEQVGDLLAALPDRYRLFGVLAAFLGLRSGEARGLRVGDVSPLHGTVTVRGQLVRERGGMTGGPEVWEAPKTKAGTRVIRVHPDVMAQISEHIAQFTTGGAGEFLLSTSTAPLLDANSAGNAFRRARAKAGLPEHVTPHTLRHYAGSYALREEGTTVTDVQHFLGHSSARVTADVYLHRTAGADDRVAAGMGASFALVSARSV